MTLQQCLVSPKHELIGVPPLPELVGLFPDAKTIQMGDKNVLLLPHRGDVVRLCRNVGLDVPAPVLSQYNFPGGPAFDAQIKTAALLTTEPRAFVLNGMGTGKTRAALWSWDFLYTKGEAGKLLVVAPLSTLYFTWKREAFTILPHRKCVVLHGTKDKRLKALEEDADIFVINHDGMHVMEDVLTKRSDIDVVVLDELAVYRNGQAKRTKAMRRFVNAKKFAWGMTGSPTPRAPTDAWGQCSILAPHRVPRYFKEFQEQTMRKVTEFKWTPKEGALDTVYKAMQPAVRFTLDDVVELPDLVERTQDVNLSARQSRVYKELELHALSAVAEGVITAVNAGVVLNKLLQVSLGYVYTSDGGAVVDLDASERLQAMVDIVEGTDRKVIVFTPFKHSLAGISSALAKEGIDHAEVSGDTSASKRGEIFGAFQSTDKYRVLAAHPACMAHGLTLTAADTIIWFGPITNLETFEQANARIRRVGQHHKQQVIMLQGTKVEKKIYSALRAKQAVQNQLLDMFKE